MYQSLVVTRVSPFFLCCLRLVVPHVKQQDCVAGLQALLWWPLLTEFPCGRLLTDGAAFTLRASTHDLNTATFLLVHAKASPDSLFSMCRLSRKFICQMQRQRLSWSVFRMLAQRSWKPKYVFCHMTSSCTTLCHLIWTTQLSVAQQMSSRHVLCRL